MPRWDYDVWREEREWQRDQSLAEDEANTLDEPPATKDGSQE